MILNYSITTVLEELIGVSGINYVLTEGLDFSEYGKDQTGDLSFPFEILIKPGTVEEIAEILKICNRYKMPLTPRGGGSGVTGGALPVQGGVVLSMERLNKIISINKTDGYVMAEAGTITSDLCEQVAQLGLYFPVPPSSSSYSFIGGNVAENAGSINSCLYGTTARYVLNLEVVLPSGEIIWTGANVLKNATGLNLTQLYVGSEGTLGIITKVVYRLMYKPTYEISLLATFEHLQAACNALVSIKQSGLSPSAVELIGNNALQITAAYLNEPLPFTNNNNKTQLLINIQDTTEAGLNHTLETLALLLEQHTQEEILTAITFTEKEKLWKLRYSIGTALTSGNKKYRDIDCCIPLSCLYKYLQKVETIGKQYDIPLACFGHALDGNIHTMLLLNHPGKDNEKIKKAVHAIYTYAIENGGVISGEHGIGLLQKEFMEIQFSKAHLTLMQNIKHLFDPEGILNPGKIF